MGAFSEKSVYLPYYLISYLKKNDHDKVGGLYCKD